MTSTVSVSPIGFLSHDGKTPVKGLVWSPQVQTHEGQKPPRCIVHLVHGMAEHLGRYDEFARFLVGQGYVVCGTDMLGHGKSTTSSDKLGCLPLHDGKTILIEDVHELRKTVGARYARQTPYVLFGHSMGSFMVRSYMACYPEGIAGVVVCGSGQQPRALSLLGNFFARRIAAAKGQDYKSTFLDNLGIGAFAKKIKGARTRFDWLSVDSQVVDKYIDDDLCGFMFSAGGYATLTDLTAEIVTSSCAKKVPSDVPVLFISGALDPVGNYGRGIQSAARTLRAGGVKSVDVMMYPGMRHEILNEPHHAKVYTDIAKWIEEHACENPTL